MRTEDITLIISILNLVLTIALAILIAFLKHGFDKKMKKFTLVVAELSELNTKIHDGLVDSEELIRKGKVPTEHIRKRLKYGASRLFKYDNGLKSDILNFLNGWEEKTLSSKKLLLLIDKIKKKIDGLILNLG